MTILKIILYLSVEIKLNYKLYRTVYYTALHTMLNLIELYTLLNYIIQTILNYTKSLWNYILLTTLKVYRTVQYFEQYWTIRQKGFQYSVNIDSRYCSPERLVICFSVCISLSPPQDGEQASCKMNSLGSNHSIPSTSVSTGSQSSSVNSLQEVPDDSCSELHHDYDSTLESSAHHKKVQDAHRHLHKCLPYFDVDKQKLNVCFPVDSWKSFQLSCS